MSYKISIRIPDNLYEKIKLEAKTYGYKGISSYIITLLEKKNVTEIKGGKELASAIFQFIRIADNMVESKERKTDLCQCYDLLMIKIEELKNSVESLNTQTGIKQ